MFLQGRLHQLQMQQSESQLLTTLQVQMYCIELCKMVIYTTIGDACVCTI